MRKDKNKRINQVLKRDRFRCGIHADGCGKKIDISNENPTLDHIIPKSFLHTQWKSLDRASYLFRGLWNLQVMCEECNRKKEGQLIEYPTFKCRCHCIYINMNGDRYIYYKNGTRVEKRLFFKGHLEERGKARPGMRASKGMNLIMAKGGRDGKRCIGFSRIKGSKIGHQVNDAPYFVQILNNIAQLFNISLWEEAIQECNYFIKEYEKDYGVGLKVEVGVEDIGFISKIYTYLLLGRLYKQMGLETGLCWLAEERRIYQESKSLRLGLGNLIIDFDKNNYEIILKKIIQGIDNHILYLEKNNILVIQKEGVKNSTYGRWVGKEYYRLSLPSSWYKSPIY